MRLSQLFARTLREDPAEAEAPSHKLLLRAAFVRKLMAGVYTTMPLGLRTIRKIEAIVRQEMDAALEAPSDFNPLQEESPFDFSNQPPGRS